MAKKKEQEEIRSTELYGGQVRLDFYPNRQRYRYKVYDNGEEVKPPPPSVTTITDMKDKSGPLMRWAVNCALEICRQNILPDQIHGAQFLADVWKKAAEEYNEVKLRAADVGTLAHSALYHYFSLPPDQFAPPLAGTPVRARFDEAVKWFGRRKIESVCREQPIYSRKHKYVGTLDHLAYVDDVLSLLDYKAAKNVYSTYVFQTSAYIMAREEETGERIEQIRILQIGEEKTIPYYYNREQIEIAFEGFLGLLNMYRADKNIGKIKPEDTWLEEL